MIIFTAEKYIPIESDVVQMSISDQGYLLIGLDTYFDLAKYQMPQIKVADKFNHRELYDWFVSVVPEPVSYLGILIDLLDFEIPMDLEPIFGCFSVILKNHSIDELFCMPRDKFSAIRLSAFAMKEYLVPRKLFLAECLKYEDLVSEAPKPTYNFLYLAPVTPGNIPAQTFTPTTSPSPEEDVDDYHYYIANKSRFQYFGDGTFLNNDTGEMFELDNYNEEELCEVYGLEVPNADPPVPTPEPASVPETPVEGPKSPAPVVIDNVEEEAEKTKSITDLFKNVRGR